MNLIRIMQKRLRKIMNWYLKASWKKKLVITTIVLIALFLLTSPLRIKPPQYETATVTRGTVSDVVSESGNVTSSGRFDIYSPSTGYIEEVYVQNGDSVDLGENLFKVKSTATPEDKAKTYSDFLTAQNNLNAEKSQMNSLKSALFKANQTFVNDRGVDNPSNEQKADPMYIQQESDWLQAESNYNNQAGIINQAGAAFTKASLAYQATQDMIVIAPAPGTVANFSASIGDKVTASSTTLGVSVLAILSELSISAIKIPLNEVDVNKVKVGQTATITFDAFREKEYKGHVATIDTAGTNTNGVITYNASVVIDNPDENIKTEMTTTVSIETAKHENVLIVPNNAIKPYQGKKAVLILGAGKDKVNGKTLPFHYVPVEIGLKGITKTEVTTGVTEGEKVVTNTGSLLKSGQ